jgi:hypothetical protein
MLFRKLGGARQNDIFTVNRTAICGCLKHSGLTIIFIPPERRGCFPAFFCVLCTDEGLAMVQSDSTHFLSVVEDVGDVKPVRNRAELRTLLPRFMFCVGTWY